MAVDNTLPFWGQELSRRVERIEDLEPAVIAHDVKNIQDEIKSLRRAFNTFSFSVVGSAILFAFTVFALLGKP